MVGNLLLVYGTVYFFFHRGEEGGNDDDGNAVYISVLEGDKRKICNVEYGRIYEENDGSV